MGNLGKATSFVDPEGDGDVMPKLVDMLTKVGKRITSVQHPVDDFIPIAIYSQFYCPCRRLELRCQSSLAKVVLEAMVATMMKTGASICASPLCITNMHSKTSCQSVEKMI